MTERERWEELLSQDIPVMVKAPFTGEPMCIDLLQFGTTELESFINFLVSHGAILPPCKIGDEVYRISKRYGCWVVLPRYVSALTYRGGKWWDVFTTTNDMLGSTVFLTREEAEEAIQRRKERKNE